jgi:Zn-finger nucleic acid-binding protein
MTEAGALLCPQCGAPASPTAPACAYCNTPLALVACPTCFANVFKGAKHCSYCGAGAAREAAAAVSDRSCPRCNSVLTNATVGKVTLAQCSPCGGVWADAASFQQICAEREEQVAVLGTAFAAPAAASGKGQTAAPDRYWPCPQCGRLMNRMNFAHCSGVIVDLCKAHGVWFDHDELRRIVEFIRSGGLDRARQHEKAEIEELRQKMKQEQRQNELREARGGVTMIRMRSTESDIGDVVSAVRGLLGWFR